MGYSVLDNKNIRTEFFKRLNNAEAGSWASRIAMNFSSDRETENYKWLASVAQMREWLGSRHQKRVRDEAYDLRNVQYEATMDVPIPDQRRDKTGQIMLRVQELAVRAATHWEKLLSTLIIAGEVSLCYDGQAFFDTDHVSGASGTQTNDLTVTEVPSANVSDTSAPTATELSKIFVEMVQHMYSFKDDSGEPINQNAMAFDIMIPVPFMANAMTALSAQFLASGVSNVAMGSGFKFNLIVNPRLTWTTQLAMFRSDGAMKPFIMQNETPILTKFQGAGSDVEFRDNTHLFGIDVSRAAGYGRWEHAALVTLS